MTRIAVDPAALRGASGRLRRLVDEGEHDARDTSRVVSGLDVEIRARERLDHRLKNLANKIETQSQLLARHADFLADAASRYERAEARLISEAGGRSRSGLLGPGGLLDWRAQTAFLMSLLGWGWANRGKEFDLGAGFSSKFFTGSASADWKKGLSAEGHIAELNGEWGKGPFGAQVSAKMGNAEAYAGKWKVGLWKTNDKTGKMEFKPGVSAKVGVGVSALELAAKGGVGDERLGATAEAEGKVLSAEASAKGTLGFDEKGRFGANVKAKAMASVFSGSVSGGFNILGLHIGGTAEGHALSAGVEGKAGWDPDKQKFTVKFGAALGLGGGLELNIGLAQPRPGPSSGSGGRGMSGGGGGGGGGSGGGVR